MKQIKDTRIGSAPATFEVILMAIEIARFRFVIRQWNQYLHLFLQVIMNVLLCCFISCQLQPDIDGITAALKLMLNLMSLQESVFLSGLI